MKAYRDYLLFKEAETDFGYEPITADLYSQVMGEIEKIFAELISLINRNLATPTPGPAPTAPVAPTPQVPPVPPAPSGGGTYGLASDWWKRNSGIIFREQQRFANSLELYERSNKVSKELGSLLKEAVAIPPEQLQNIIKGIEQAKAEITDIVDKVFRKRTAPPTEGVSPERLEKIQRWVKAWRQAREELGLPTGKTGAAPTPKPAPESKKKKRGDEGIPPPVDPLAPIPLAADVPGTEGGAPTIKAIDKRLGDDILGDTGDPGEKSSLIKPIDQPRLPGASGSTVDKDKEKKPATLGDPRASESPFKPGSSSGAPIEPQNELSVFKDLTDKVPLDNKDENYIKAMEVIINILASERPDLAKDGVDISEIAEWLKSKNLKLDDFAPGGRFSSKDAYIKSPDPSDLRGSKDTGGEIARDSDDWAYAIGNIAEYLAKRRLGKMTVTPEEVASVVDMGVVDEFMKQEIKNDEQLKPFLPTDKDSERFKPIYQQTVDIGKQLISGKPSGGSAIDSETARKANRLIDEFKSKRRSHEWVFDELRKEDNERFERIFNAMNRRGKGGSLDWVSRPSNIKKLVQRFYGITPESPAPKKRKMASEQVQYYLDLMRSGQKKHVIGESLKGKNFTERTALLRERLRTISC